MDLAAAQRRIRAKHDGGGDDLPSCSDPLVLRTGLDWAPSKGSDSVEERPWKSVAVTFAAWLPAARSCSWSRCQRAWRDRPGRRRRVVPGRTPARTIGLFLGDVGDVPVQSFEPLLAESVGAVAFIGGDLGGVFDVAQGSPKAGHQDARSCLAPCCLVIGVWLMLGVRAE